jgi:hypothetical protein
LRGETVVTNFQFRLNGVIITHIKVRPVVIEGSTDGWELVACHERLGDFAIDDNDALPDPCLPQFVLEVRDVTIPPIERRFLPNKGWKKVSTKECIALLGSFGVVDCRRLMGIPVKVNIDSGGKPNGVPERR